MNVPRYKPFNSTKLSAHGLYGFNQRTSSFDRDGDIDALDINLKSNGRYWSAKTAALESHKNFKRLRLLAPKQTVVIASDDLIPFSETQVSGGGVDHGSVPRASLVEELRSEYALRMTVVISLSICYLQIFRTAFSC